MTKYGFHGKLLRVDLTQEKIETQDIPDDLIQNYLGGSGIAVNMLFEQLDAKIKNPLDPQAVLVIITGLLTGTGVPTGCKASFCAHSPLTGIWGESSVGGNWSSQLKFTGFDGIVVTGKSKKPVYLWIHDGKCEVKSAAKVWGKDTYETARLLVKETAPNAQVAAIGVAGERLVKFAAVVVGVPQQPRAAGRCGMGAIMGSKNLKAIVVAGSQKPQIFDNPGLRNSIKELMPGIREKTEGLRKYGTGGSIQMQEMWGDLPIKNFLESRWEKGAARINGQTMMETMGKKNYACFSCPIACGKELNITTGEYAPLECVGPEYETLVSLGSLLLNDNLASIAKANDLCNLYGLDTISAGSAIAFAIEACDRGILTKKEPAGRELKWSDPKVILELIRKIAYREGIGDLLAEGTRAAATRLGGISIELAQQIKGLEMSYHDPRGNVGMALSYATASRGGCHLDALTFYVEMGAGVAELDYTGPTNPHTEEGKAELVFKLQNLGNVFNATGMCKFILRAIGGKTVTRWLNLTMGWELDVARLYRIGERIHNLKRCYNIRCGMAGSDDTLPPRLLSLARNKGNARGVLPNLKKMLDEYYALRGWTTGGRPTRAKLQELGLNTIKAPNED